jgi:hypothetical protein
MKANQYITYVLGERRPMPDNSKYLAKISTTEARAPGKKSGFK